MCAEARRSCPADGDRVLGWRESPTLRFPGFKQPLSTSAPYQGLHLASASPCFSAFGKNSWLPELFTAHLPNLGKGTVNRPVASPLGTSGIWNSNGDSVDSHQGTSICFIPSEKSLWPIRIRPTLPSLRCCYQPSSFPQLPVSPLTVGGSVSPLAMLCTGI